MLPACSVAQSCLALCDPVACSPPGSSVPGLLQARTLEWGAVPASGGPSPPRDGPASRLSPALAGGFLATSTTWEAHYHVKQLEFGSLSIVAASVILI